MKTLLVIFGGRSPEHDVSIISALTSVIAPLELTNKYDVQPLYIAKDGSWHWDARLKDISLYRTGAIEQFVTSDAPVNIEYNGGLTITKRQSLGRQKKVSVDIVFPVMHGSYGEDGALMGLLEMAGVPYVGCDVPSSAIAMDKVLSKQVASAAGIETGTWQCFYAEDFKADQAAVLKRLESLTYPLFVKPTHAGSSIGITRVEDKSALKNAIEVALHYDSKVIVEQAIDNLIEVTLPIMGNSNPVPALLEQPATGDETFFDFETKYMNGGKKKGGTKVSAKAGAQGYSTLPAKLETNLYKTAEQLGLAVYRVLGCSGTARVDMLINSKTGTVYFNEINPMPGSLYAHNWRAAGVSNIELVEKLIQLAEERFSEKKSIQTSFSTNYLKQF